MSGDHKRAAEVAAAWDALPTRTRGALIADPVTHELAASASWLAAEVESASRKRARRPAWRARFRAWWYRPMSEAQAAAFFSARNPS